jgi:DNA-binding transcriptional regulator PaaX
MISHLLRVLCDSADAKGVVQRITIGALHEATGYSEDTIAAATKRLERAGRISVARRFRVPNVYTITKGVSARILPEAPTATHLVDRRPNISRAR